jgi:hypothetical protein
MSFESTFVKILKSFTKLRLRSRGNRPPIPPEPMNMPQLSVRGSTFVHMLPCDTKLATSSQVPGLQLTAHGMLVPESVLTIGSCERCDGNTSKCEDLGPTTSNFAFWR